MLDDEDRFGTDEELDAECRLLGSLMLDPRLVDCVAPLSPLAFCSSFHGAAYYHIIAILFTGGVADPVTVWERVMGHEDAETMGLEQLVGLVADASAPERFLSDQLILSRRALRRYMKSCEGQTAGLVH